MAQAQGLIDVRTHAVPEALPRCAGRHLADSGLQMAPALVCHRHMMLSGKVYRTVSHPCWSCTLRLAEMNARAVARQVLSPMPELLSHWLPVEDGSAICRDLNEVIAAMVAEAGARFHGLGAVAIGDARFLPFFEAVAAFGAAVFVHPLRPGGMDRLVGPPALEQVLAFANETGLAAASMITGGTLARLPNLRIAFSHGGGSLQALLPRLRHAWRCLSPRRDALADDPLLLAQRLYCDDLVYDAATIIRLVEVFGASQAMAGTDYPFAIMDDDPAGRIASLQFTPEQAQQLRCGNAERWLGQAPQGPPRPLHKMTPASPASPAPRSRPSPRPRPHCSSRAARAAASRRPRPATGCKAWKPRTRWPKSTPAPGSPKAGALSARKSA